MQFHYQLVSAFLRQHCARGMKLLVDLSGPPATHCGRRVHREIEPEIFPAAPHVKVDSSRQKHRGVALTSPTVQEFADTRDAFWLHQRTWLDWRKLRSGRVRSGYHCGAWRRV